MSVIPLSISMVSAILRTKAGDILAATRRPIRVNANINGIANRVVSKVVLSGKVPKGTIATRINEVTLNTASSVKRISCTDQF